MGLVLALSAHAVGWPVAKGGSQNLANALAACLQSLGGVIATGAPVENIDELGATRAVLCDVTPRQLLRIAGHRLPTGYRKRLSRFQYGPGVWKLDWALDGPIPWKATEVSRTGPFTFAAHLMKWQTLKEQHGKGGIARSPTSYWFSRRCLIPPAPAGKHTAWAYCHVPHGSTFDMTDRIEAQVWRFAPGFRDRIIAKHVMSPAALEFHNPNLVGGDITGGDHVAITAFHPPRRPRQSLHHAAPRRLPVLRLHPTRRRSPWHVRLLGGTGGPGPDAADEADGSKTCSANCCRTQHADDGSQLGRCMNRGRSWRVCHRGSARTQSRNSISTRVSSPSIIFRTNGAKSAIGRNGNNLLAEASV